MIRVSRKMDLEYNKSPSGLTLIKIPLSRGHFGTALAYHSHLILDDLLRILIRHEYGTQIYPRRSSASP